MKFPELYHPDKDPDRPANEIDYRPNGGPLLRYLWCDDELHGQTLYLGGEIGSDGKIYYIPGHAPRVMRLDPDTDQLELIGPEFQGKFKWLRGVVVGDIIYGLPCNTDSILRINCKTGEIRTMDIPYEQMYKDDPVVAKEEREKPWKYHGGDICPLDNCIYAIPQSSLHVLRVNPQTDTCELVGPPIPGKYKFYGGVVGKQDGAIYGITHDSPHVLRITPDKITLHGDKGPGGHKWHGASKAKDGTIVCVPANADSVLCIVPGEEPEIYELGDESIIQTGRHRNDKKYKYLGAMTGGDGKVYIFPSGSEMVLQVDTEKRTLRNLPPNIYDHNLERICQNKWQNGLTHQNYVYGIPLAAESLLTIDTNVEPPKVETWDLPSPHRGLGKFEGGIVGPNGILYTVPNNHKAVLRIEPKNVVKKDTSKVSERAEPPENKDHLVYQSGIPTLRSSAHRVKFDPKKRLHDPKPKDRNGKETGTLWLPDDLLKEHIISFQEKSFKLKDALVDMLDRCDSNIVGAFKNGSRRLEDFVVPTTSTWRKVNGGQCESSQKYLSDRVANDQKFLTTFDEFVESTVLPWLKDKLVKAGAVPSDEGSVIFYYQRPPTLRLQPGPAWSQVKAHNDAEYGHQNGELNFWLPFTDRELNGVDLWCETASGTNDYHPIKAEPGEIISFHGSSCKHFVNANETEFTRVSMDFRVGVGGFFDPHWQMKGTTDDHGRREVIM